MMVQFRGQVCSVLGLHNGNNNLSSVMRVHRGEGALKTSNFVKKIQHPGNLHAEALSLMCLLR